jgi:2-oxoglutarate/2-oxoacid ferredoxin oxidoreductase subunit beta
MTNTSRFDLHKPQWCPGCGNFDLLECVKLALTELDLQPHNVMLSAGIGQASKLGFSLNTNMFNGLHGRSLPLALGMHMANHEAPILVIAGDGCLYAEGGNHFLHNLRRNLNVTILASDNRVYGLTKGQASPTASMDYVTKIHPDGVGNQPFLPSAVALVAGATFVAKAFTGKKEQIVDLLKRAIQHRGTSVLDIMSPCISFNKVNTFKWYKDNATDLPVGHDPGNIDTALSLAMHGHDGKIPTGLYYQVDRPVFGDHRSAMSGEPIAKRTLSHRPEQVAELFEKYK